MIIRPQCLPGRHNHCGHTPECLWPEDCMVQWGDNGMVLDNLEKALTLGEKPNIVRYTAFFEAFPTDPDTFIRGEGKSVSEAEMKAFKCFEKQKNCQEHEFEKRGYKNGCGICRKCGLFMSSIFSVED